MLPGLCHPLTDFYLATKLCGAKPSRLSSNEREAKVIEQSLV